MSVVCVYVKTQIFVAANKLLIKAVIFIGILLFIHYHQNVTRDEHSVSNLILDNL
jgi:hypothetical protein